MNADSKEKISLMLDLAKKNEVDFCMRIASDLTIRTRSLYAMDGVEVIVLYKAFNELMHVVINQSLNAENGNKRYSLDEFIKIIISKANSGAVGSALSGAFDALLARDGRAIRD